MCEGRSISTGRCNDFDCGDVSPETIEAIYENINSNNFNYEIHESEKVYIENFNEMISQIQIESPKAQLKWILNGFELNQPETDHVEFIGNDILIKDTKPTDSGVYMCVLSRINGEQVIIRVTSVAILSKSIDVIKRASQEISTKCNSITLSYVYSKLNLKLIHNDLVYMDYGLSILNTVDMARIILQVNFSGIWKCLVTEVDLNFTWTTSIIQMEIKTKPTFYTHLAEDQFTSILFRSIQNPIYIWLVLISIVILAFGLASGGVYFYNSFKKLKENPEYEMRRHR